MTQPKRKYLNRRKKVWGTMVLLMSIQGCATFTYPSPQAVEGSQIVSVYPHNSETLPHFSGFAGLLCPRLLRAVKHDAMALTVGGKVALCFASPTAGYYRLDSTGNHIVTSPLPSPEPAPCAGRIFGKVYGEKSRLIFQVSVGGKDIALGVDQTLGTLEVNGRSTTVLPQVQTSEFHEMPPSKSVDEKQLFNVNGSWQPYTAEVLDYELTHLKYPAYLLKFEFDQDCDPDAHYRLTIKGIKIDGSELHVPPVEFEPYSETSPIFD